MKIKMTLGEIKGYMTKALTQSRLKMQYACETEPRKWFSNKPVNKTPIENDFEYWQIMKTFHPWKELEGVFAVCGTLPLDREAWVSCEAAARMTSLAVMYDEEQVKENN